VRRSRRPIAVALGGLALTCCQEPGQPGPAERAGTAIDRSINDAKRGIGEASQSVGQSLGEAARSAGGAASRFGREGHDALVPPPPLASAPPAPAPAADAP
jgi:hypothetical protein